MHRLLVQGQQAQGGAEVTLRFVVGMAIIVAIAIWFAQPVKKAVR